MLQLIGQIQKWHNKSPDSRFDASISFSKTIMFYSECPGEVYDEYEDYLGEEFNAPIEQETKGKFVVMYHHKHDLTILRKEFPTMKDALETVYENGQLHNLVDFETVRSRATI